MTRIDCNECGGCGMVMVPHEIIVPRCCGRAEQECGGCGCTGPEPDVELEYETEPCPACNALEPTNDKG